MTPNFPLVAGLVSIQLPVRRAWKSAQALLMTPGGDWHLRTLPTGEYIEWQLKFSGLTDSEVLTLKQFHHDMRGSYHRFRFCDPMRNLLAWSEDPTREPWARSGELAISLQPSSGTGTLQTAQLLNLSDMEGAIRQAVGCSPSFSYSLAVKARSNSNVAIGLSIGDQRKDFSMSSEWQSYRLSAAPGGTTDQVVFAISLPMGGSAELAGVHAEFGESYPEYLKSEGRQGLFTNARFKDDLLVVSSEEAGVHSAEFSVVAKLGE